MSNPLRLKSDQPDQSNQGVSAPEAPPAPVFLSVREKRKRALAEALSATLLLHVGIGVAAGVITIAVIISKPAVTFEAKKPPTIPARKLEHSIRVKQMKEQIRKPQILQRLVSAAPSKVALPELPRMDMPDMKNMRDTPTLNRAGSDLGALGGQGGGAGRGLGGGAGYSDALFFGQNVRTRAITICMDISPSMVAKGVVKEVREEARKMLGNLSPATKFNIVVFVDGATPFTPQMVFATRENKEKAQQWLAQEFDFKNMGQLRGFSGSTPFEAIKLAAEMGSDTIFVLGDDLPYLKQGNAQAGTEITDHVDQILDFVRGIEAKYGQTIKINPIAYKPHPNERGKAGTDFMKTVARVTGGRFQQIDKLKYADVGEGM
jgi:enamine deaminase RidA (YjgF/YER057c/UK114 family)